MVFEIHIDHLPAEVRQSALRFFQNAPPERQLEASVRLEDGSSRFVTLSVRELAFRRGDVGLAGLSKDPSEIWLPNPQPAICIHEVMVVVGALGEEPPWDEWTPLVARLTEWGMQHVPLYALAQDLGVPVRPEAVKASFRAVVAALEALPAEQREALAALYLLAGP